MFRDIVSNLSFSPSATAQLTYYWRRLRKEQLTRQLSMVMAAALVMLQVATMIAPPDAANACGSNNDLIPCGLNTQNPISDLLSHYYHDPGMRELYNHYGIDADDIKNAHTGTIHKDAGWLSFGHNRAAASDKMITIAGQTYYIRPLSEVALQDSFPAVIGRRAVDNKLFAVLDACGNLELMDLTPQKTKTPPTTQTPTTPTTPTTTPVLPTGTPPKTPTPTHTTYTPPTTTPPVVNLPPTPTGVPNITIQKRGLLIEPNGNRKDANGATANAGDSIQYTLTTLNTGNASKKDWVVIDDIRDILEYATVTNLGGATQFNGQLSWKPKTIAGHGRYQVQFTVQIKSPIPTTPRSISDPQSYDLQIDNFYGTMVSTHLTVPAQKAVEVAAATLPQTGAGTDLIIVLLFGAVITYFYFRNRQLVNEISILRGDHHGPGGAL